MGLTYNPKNENIFDITNEKTDNKTDNKTDHQTDRKNINNKTKPSTRWTQQTSRSKPRQI